MGMPDNGFLSLAQAFRALQRLYVVVDPGFGEHRWRGAHEFEALPAEKRSPGHWYRFQSGHGFILVDQTFNGQWVSELPTGIDSASVNEVPAVSGIPLLLDSLGSVLARLPESANNRPQL